MRRLAERVAALECQTATSGGIEKDFRVIEMQIARAEEKLLRWERTASLTRPYLLSQQASA